MCVTGSGVVVIAAAVRPAVRWRWVVAGTISGHGAPATRHSARPVGPPAAPVPVNCTGRGRCKLQALVYDILYSTTAVFSYAIGSRKLSANEQFFVSVQTIVRLLQTTQIKQGVSFIAASKVYTSTNKTTIV